MAPGLRVGDVVAARPVVAAQLRDGEIRRGSVLLVDDPDRPGRLRLHRWVGVRGDALVLRGDANTDPDSSTVAPGAVHAVGFLRVPLVGLPVVWARTGKVLPLLATAGAFVIVLLLAFPGSTVRRRPPPGSSTTRRMGRWYRRRTTGVALPLIAVLVAAQPGAWSAFSKTTTVSGRSSLASQTTYDCFAKTYPGVPTPSLRWSYTSTSSNTEADQSGNGHDGKITYVSMRTAAACGGDPYISTSAASTYAYQVASVPSPAQFGISVWFRTSTPQGKLAGFGDAGTGNSTTYDRHIYMSSSGLLTFGVQTASGRTTCTSSATFGDGAWHLVVATYSAGALTLWTDDGQAACTATASGTILSYTGYWQFGNDALDKTVWPNASNASYFKGDLDETAVYDTPLTLADERAIYAAGR